MDWRQIMGNEHFHPIEQKEQKEQKGCEGGSIATIAAIALKNEIVKNMSEEEYRFEERAAIMELHGGLRRQDAETLARERNDPACQRCRPERRPQSEGT